MKKRNKPFALMAILVVVFLGVALLNAKQMFGAKPNNNEEQQRIPEVSGQSRAPEAKTALDDSLKSAVSGEKGGAPQAKMSAAVEDDIAGGPSVVIPKQAPSKPKPNDHSTSTQWWSNESRIKNKK